jgi:hypothetical protein
MKKELLFAFAAFFFMSLSAITGVYAVEEANTLESVIVKEQMDVTGDGKLDTIYVKGEPFEEGAIFLRSITLEILSATGKSHKINLEGGYEPQIDFKDLNNDGVKDIFLAVNTGGSGGLSNHYLFTVKDDQLTDLTVPEPLVIQTSFLNGYKANMTIENTNESYQFDLRNRAKDYERLGLYHNGKLNEPAELMVLPFGTLKPVKVNGNQMGLKGSQRISGAYNADSIAYVESSWVYENGKWKLLDTNVMELRRNTTKKKK